MEQVLGISNQATSVLVKTVQNGQEPKDELILMEYGVREQVKTYDEKASSAVKDAVTAFGIINGISTGVSLVIAMVVTFIVVYINTINKRRQIGILKAIGIHKTTIVLSYLFQVMFMVTLGSILGIFLAFLLITYLNIHPLVFPGGAVYPMVEAGPFIRSIILLYIVSLISGFVPSYKTSKEPILDAIRGTV